MARHKWSDIRDTRVCPACLGTGRGHIEPRYVCGTCDGKGRIARPVCTCHNGPGDCSLHDHD